MREIEIPAILKRVGAKRHLSTGRLRRTSTLQLGEGLATLCGPQLGAQRGKACFLNHLMQRPVSKYQALSPH